MTCSCTMRSNNGDFHQDAIMDIQYRNKTLFKKSRKCHRIFVYIYQEFAFDLSFQLIVIMLNRLFNQIEKLHNLTLLDVIHSISVHFKPTDILASSLPSSKCIKSSTGACDSLSIATALFCMLVSACSHRSTWPGPRFS